MRVYRRALRIPWTACRTQTSILNLSPIKNENYRNTVKIFRHITRKTDSLIHTILQRIPGYRNRGGVLFDRWMDGIKRRIELTFIATTRKTGCREEKRKVVHIVSCQCHQIFSRYNERKKRIH